MSSASPDLPLPSSGGIGPIRWSDALLAAKLFAIDPVGLAGIVVKGGPGPLRDRWQAALAAFFPSGTPFRRMPPAIADDRLLGGVDLLASLALGKPVLQRGLLAETDGGIVVIPMAERLDAGGAARIAAVLDSGEVRLERDGVAGLLPARLGVVAFDESREEERVPEALTERLAFHIDLDGLAAGQFQAQDHNDLRRARDFWSRVQSLSISHLEALAAAAASFGISSVRPVLLAARAARAAAALAQSEAIAEEHVLLAARLVLAPRAIMAPESESPPEQPEEQNRQEEEREQKQDDPPEGMGDLQQMVLEAVAAALPPGLLDQLRSGTAPMGRRGAGSGAGAQRRMLHRGRPAGCRPGMPRPGRLAVIDTLRAAAPWQKLRREESGGSPGAVLLRREDFRIRRFVQRRDATIVFCVDASGSAAFHRLAEAKGAVELLLAEAYAARTHVALVSFRGQSAEILLPPTRSLSRAKRLLNHLPGGGGTPLASGIDAAMEVALIERSKGRDPLLILLTDGRANIARDGSLSRTTAMAEAELSASTVRASRLRAVFIDTSPRHVPGAAPLAAIMQARYVALPYVDAASVRDAVRL